MSYYFSSGIHFFDGEEYLPRAAAASYIGRCDLSLWRAAKMGLLSSIKLGPKVNSPVLYKVDDLHRLWGRPHHL